ncbi:MAG: hypothetical protein RL417_950 [Pseudomonadota bacterium]|jgi:thiol-disulfide isomerase/thioredoxin
MPAARTVIVAASMVLWLGGCAITPGSSTTAPQYDLALRTLSGEAQRLSAFRGRPTLLHFWATWCATCREEMGSLAHVVREVSEIEVVAVAVEDDSEAVVRFIEAEKLPFPVLLDEGEARARFSITTLPFTVFLDRDGAPIRFLDPASGAPVTELAEPRYWGSRAALERVRTSIARSESVKLARVNED